MFDLKKKPTIEQKHNTCLPSSKIMLPILEVYKNSKTKYNFVLTNVLLCTVKGSIAQIKRTYFLCPYDFLKMKTQTACART